MRGSSCEMHRRCSMVQAKWKVQCMFLCIEQEVHLLGPSCNKCHPADGQALVNLTLHMELRRLLVMTNMTKQMQACQFSAAHPQMNATPDPRSWQTETIYEIDVVQAQDLNPDLTFTDDVVHFGDVPADCVARAVGHDGRSCAKDITSGAARTGI